MYYKEAATEDTIVLWSSLLLCLPFSYYNLPCDTTYHYLEKCVPLVTVTKDGYGLVNNHNHERNLIPTRGQLSQQCKIYRQGAAHFS